MIACRNDIKVSSLPINSIYECVACSVEISPDVKIAIASVYFPSNSTHPLTAAGLDLLINQIPDSKLVLGDFNSHCQQWGGLVNDRRSRSIIKVLDDNNLITLNTGQPTRIACPPIQASALDISVCSANLALKCSWQVGENPHGSDHLPIVITYALSQSLTTHLLHSRNLLKHIIWDKFKQTIINSTIFEDAPTLDGYERFINFIVESATSSQSKPFSNEVRHFRYTPKLWWTAEIDACYKNKQTAFRNFRRIGGRVEYLQYKQLDAKFRSLKSSSKKIKWREYCSSLNKDTPLSSMF